MGISFKEISEVKYFKKDGAEETMPATDYSLTKLNDKVFQIRFKQVPEIANQWDAMTIKATIGMTTVPKPIAQSVLLMVSDMYERREDRVEVPLTAAHQSYVLTKNSNTIKNPFIGQLNRKIKILEPATIRNTTGEEEVVLNLLFEPWRKMMEVSGDEDVEGK